LALFFVLPFLASQPYTIDWGPENRREGGLFSNYRLVGLTDDAYHLVMRPRKSNTLLSFSMDHRLIANSAINFRFGKQDLKLKDFVETRAGRFAYFAEFDKRADTWSLYVSPFKNNKFGEIKRAYSHAYQAQFLFNVFSVNNNLGGDIVDNLTVSPDSSQVAFVNVLSSRARDSNDAYAIAVFDEAFNLRWKKVQAFPYDDRFLEVIQTTVSNDGTLYLLARLLDRPTLFVKKEDRGLPRYDYKVFKVTENDLATFDITLEEGTAPQYAGLFFPDANSANFLVGGFYTTNERRSGLKGLFLNRVNVTNNTVDSKMHPLDREFLADLVTRRAAKQDRGLNSNFRIRNFLQFADGSLGFIAEEFFVTVTQSMGPNNTWQERTVYHSNQIVLPRFSAEGELLNIQKIDKAFRSQNFGMTSYAMALANGKVYLIYNDFKNSEERRELRGEGRGRGRYTDLSVIDENGEITTQETLFSSREIDMTFIPRQSDYSATHLLLTAVKGKRYKCGLLKLE
ncbi:MAG: hypothetical protein AAGJ82_15260, partial [Bacteroidota bacterium]